MTPQQAIKVLEEGRQAHYPEIRKQIADVIRELLRERHKNFNPGMVTEKNKFVTGPVGPTPQDQIHQVKNQKGIPE